VAVRIEEGQEPTVSVIELHIAPVAAENASIAQRTIVEDQVPGSMHF